ncbi:MAG: hypothetical protein KA419_14450 [Acidobacteria bacterium]|nr:hypothetical protein [Acidobacteriota bacterium]
MNSIFLTIVILFVVLNALIVFLLFLFARRSFKAKPRGAAGLAERLGVENARDFTAGRPVVHTVDGVQCVLRYIRGGKNQPSGVSFTFPDVLLPKLTVTREGVWQKFFKKIGLTTELATGDPRFDDDFYLLTDETEYYRNYFSDAGRREAIRALFAADPAVARVQTTSAGLSVVCQVRATLKGVVSPLLGTRDAANAARALDAGPEWRSAHFTPLHADIRPLSGMLPRVVALAALIGLLLVAGLIALITGSVSFRLTEYGLIRDFFLYSLVPLAAFWLVLFKGLRGYSWSHLAFVPMALVSIAAFPLACMGSAVFLNGYLDESPAVIRQVTVLDKYSRKNKNSRSYHVTFSGWKPDQPSLTYSVSRHFYDGIDKDDALEVVTHAGYLGHEWVESIRTGESEPE